MEREFRTNHPLLFLLAGLAVAVILAQSVFSFRRAWKRVRELGLDQAKLKRTVISTAVFSVAPTLAVGIGVFALAGGLGLPLPWLRLSVVGAVMYELSAAATAADSLKIQLGETLNAVQFSTIAWTMTVGISAGLFLIPLFCKRTLNRIRTADDLWRQYLGNAVFMGLVATFAGVNFSGVTKGGGETVKALVLVLSACLMELCRFVGKKMGWKWMNDFALSICMVLAMTAAIPLTAWLI